ncbi:protein NUCLEOLAR FACTOR 1 isoform X2 [Rhododendron vialii]|nr:protein NUCLEOLAR FACTOR 1 isoform X2 [Rhododendron vialii]
MGKQSFGRKQGFKRLKPHKESGKTRKNRRTKDEIEHRPSPSDSGDSSEEHSNAASEEEEAAAAKEEEVAYREPTMYDHLLKTLSGSQSFAKAYKKRQREEEGKSDTEEDSGSELESLRASEEEDDSNEGTDKESPGSLDLKSNPQGSGLVGEHSDNVGDEDESCSEIDEARDLEVNDHSALEVSVSSFNDHLGHKLSETECDNLSKRKWKYKWEIPASDIPNCKWMGTGDCLTKDVDLSSGYSLKLRLYKHWLHIYKASGGNDFHLSRQRNFFSLFNSYRDILHHSKKPFYLKGMEEDSNVMDAYLMHSLNHIFRTGDLVTKNNAKVAKHQESADELLNGDCFLDQGFTRPKVLIVLPLASVAFRVIKRLIQLTPPTHKVNVENLDRFSDEFGTGVAYNNEDNEGDVIGNLKSQKTSKPSDFQALFGGNNNDHFMIGIKFTRRSIKLFGDFYSSDMIVASPLGLVTKIGKAEVEKEKDVDYLSSIEVLIIDHADVIAMQNWSHVNTVIGKLNHIPSKQHATDIMRIRQWYLDGHAQFYRQTIILGSYLNPEINGLFNHHCVNYQGKVKLVCEHKGVLPKVLLQVRQIYERFDAESAVDVDDARLEYFAKKVFPKIKDSVQGGIMLFISSYFEFVRVRNFLRSQDASFCLLGE